MAAVCVVSTESLLVGDVDDVAKPHFVVSIPQILTIIYTERQLDPGSHNLNLYTQGRTFLSNMVARGIMLSRFTLDASMTS